MNIFIFKWSIWAKDNLVSNYNINNWYNYKFVAGKEFFRSEKLGGSFGFLLNYKNNLRHIESYFKIHRTPK